MWSIDTRCGRDWRPLDMMRIIGPDAWVGDYIVCRPQATPATHRTKRWEVRTSLGGDVVLGGVSWYAPWRRYVFAPCMNTVYDAACLPARTRRFHRRPHCRPQGRPMKDAKTWPAPKTRTIAGRVGFSATCKITCDCCGAQSLFSASSEDQLDALIFAQGWVRFGPSGSDLCHKCKGASPNTIIQVRTP